MKLPVAFLNPFSCRLITDTSSPLTFLINIIANCFLAFILWEWLARKR